MTIQQSLRTTIHCMKADYLTPVSIFKRLQGRHKFLLESSSKYEESGRYSFIGANPRKTYFGEQTTLYDFTHDTKQQYTYNGSVLDSLKQVMPRVSSVTDFPFIGGAVGYIRYGAGTELAQPEQMPEVQFHIYDTLIIFDHIKDEVTIVYTNIAAEHQQSDIETVLTQLGKVENPEPLSFEIGELQHTTNCAQASFAGDAFELYRKLRIQLPGAYMYYMEFEGHTIIGSSKDSFVAVTNGQVQAHFNEETYQNATVEAIQKVAHNVKTHETVTGNLQQGLHSLDVLKTLLPPIHVQDFNGPRKAYGSVIGYIGFNGQIDFTLADQVLVIEQETIFVTAEHTKFTELTSMLAQLKG